MEISNVYGRSYAVWLYIYAYYNDFSGGSIYPSNGQMFFDAMNSYDTRAEGQFYGSTMNSISGTFK